MSLYTEILKLLVRERSMISLPSLEKKLFEFFAILS